MTKKNFAILAIAAIGICATFGTSIFAKNINAAAPPISYFVEKIKTQDFWTIDELEFFSQIANQELEDHCQKSVDYTDCMMSYPYEREAEDNIYRAVDAFEREKLLITFINPEDQKVKIIFRDEDRELKYMMGIDRKEAVSNLYLTRFDKKYELRDTSLIVSHIAPESHPLFVGESASLGAGWLASNTEVELVVNNLGIDEKINNGIFYLVTDAGGSTSLGYYDYSSCIDSPDYQPGGGCKIVYRGIKWDYVPAKLITQDIADHDIDSVIDDGDVDGSSINLDPTTDAEPEPTITDNHSVNTGGDKLAKHDKTESLNNTQAFYNVMEDTPTYLATNLGNKEINNQTNVEDDNLGDYNNYDNLDNIYNIYNTSKDLHAPTLGGDCRTENNNMSWWILVIIIVGTLAILLWWFMPIKKRDEKAKKS